MTGEDWQLVASLLGGVALGCLLLWTWYTCRAVTRREQLRVLRAHYDEQRRADAREFWTKVADAKGDTRKTGGDDGSV